MAPRGRIFDEMAKLMTDAAGVAHGVRREAETAVKTQAERLLSSMDVVSREEFEAVRDMAATARDENEALKKRLVVLEAKLASGAATAG
ncbi:accessory factor UbiK family protein [Lichenihabitans sp. Uapishka_5]|uniref:accessory factor UbiK family protein n=1 Tax=Lichenihabitans sp. Uapishka_5 TaxID=3037302 RepID=UPI0029E7E67D|nr:accessory factor UbiK family protein [Lichenihabitans sp. Uapishka_5]MDX7950032.1 accessory factor UbiK family protein [Lichenihabitans sp. Uapishka_5]